MWAQMSQLQPNRYQSQHESVPFWAIVLSACAVVLTGHMLGASWLAQTVFGLPAGLWMIGLVAFGAHRPTRQRAADALGGLWNLIEPGTGAVLYEQAAPANPADDALIWGWWPRGPVAKAMADGMTRLAGFVVNVALLPLSKTEYGVLAEMRKACEQFLWHCAWPTRPLRVGLCMPEDEAQALIDAPGTCAIEFYRLTNWDDPQGACRRHLFDAVVYHDGEGPMRIVTLERPDHLASCIEWAQPPSELSYGALFPGMIDPAAVVLEESTRQQVREGAGLLRAILESAATLARSSHRITLADRMMGRQPTDRIERTGRHLSLWRSSRAPACVVMGALARAASAYRTIWPSAAAIAGEAGSAYFVAAPDIEPIDRRISLLESVQGVGTTAAAALRLGAACIGALEDDEGIQWLVKADTLLRTGATRLAKLDHAAFLESELVHGSDDPMSVGRAAAGICMVCANTNPDTLGFLRDDMLEEMAYAGWLVGRDQDRSLLIRVFLEIEAAHRKAEKHHLSGSNRRKGKKHKPSRAA